MVNREKLAMWLGLIIVLSHIFISIFLWYFFSYGREDGLFIKEISLPVTLGYSLSIVKWFIDNDGIVTSKHVIGTPMVLLILLVTLTFIGGLVAAPMAFHASNTLSVNELNNAYLAIESAFGAMFSLLFSYLYGSNKPQAPLSEVPKE